MESQKEDSSSTLDPEVVSSVQDEMKMEVSSSTPENSSPTLDSAVADKAVLGDEELMELEDSSEGGWSKEPSDSESDFCDTDLEEFEDLESDVTVLESAKVGESSSTEEPGAAAAPKPRPASLWSPEERARRIALKKAANEKFREIRRKEWNIPDQRRRRKTLAERRAEVARAKELCLKNRAENLLQRARSAIVIPDDPAWLEELKNKPPKEIDPEETKVWAHLDPGIPEGITGGPTMANSHLFLRPLKYAPGSLTEKAVQESRPLPPGDYPDFTLSFGFNGYRVYKMKDNDEKRASRGGRGRGGGRGGFQGNRGFGDARGRGGYQGRGNFNNNRGGGYERGGRGGGRGRGDYSNAGGRGGYQNQSSRGGYQGQSSQGDGNQSENGRGRGGYQGNGPRGGSQRGGQQHAPGRGGHYEAHGGPQNSSGRGGHYDARGGQQNGGHSEGRGGQQNSYSRGGQQNSNANGRGGQQNSSGRGGYYEARGGQQNSNGRGGHFEARGGQQNASGRGGQQHGHFEGRGGQQNSYGRGGQNSSGRGGQQNSSGRGGQGQQYSSGRGGQQNSSGRGGHYEARGGQQNGYGRGGRGRGAGGYGGQ